MRRMFKTGEIVKVSDKTSAFQYRGYLAKVLTEADMSGAAVEILSGPHRGKRSSYMYLTRLSPLELLAHCAESEEDWKPTRISGTTT